MKGTARPPTPRPLHTLGFWGKRSAQARKGRRRQGSKPNGRDSERGVGRSPRTRRRNAGTPGYCGSFLGCFGVRDSSKRRVVSNSFCNSSASGSTVR
ncbi:hypothetical protein EFK68_17020 [Pseudomonas aeruginosa]|nr:hypothetical protein HW04_31055 [Pseudomonas aeruginosa]KAB0593718.1 hypothetical protein F7Q96_25060 [Cupriavidus gilardii]OWQ59146.1 hypothetical protein CEE61_08295 [Stenotrophomonas maltophilia]QDL64505.1 hypothetical protein EIP97_13200 [Pseudomonas aeruginosa UCBPP-PA14]ASA15506.1 hypothetical protein CDL16_15385 [Pseudomonas aeruginosa]